MQMASKMVIVTLAVLLVLAVGGVCLQIFLSRRNSRWPGLVLPLLAFVSALLPVVNIADTGSVSGNVLAVLAAVLAGNIPTLVLLAIYWAAREKLRVRTQMEKMGKMDIGEL